MISAWKRRHLNGVEISIKAVPLSSQNNAEFTAFLPVSQHSPVVQYDGIWLSMQTQQDRIKGDSRKCKRHQKKGTRIVVLVALGLWTDGGHKRRIFDREVAYQEDKASWQQLVHRL
jgi:hypothetical protein